VGGMEVFRVLVMIRLVVGASRGPEVASSLGRGLREFLNGGGEMSTEAAAEKAQPEEASSESEGSRAERAPQS
jgi:Sec-independent protein translocase protein TatA